MTPEQEAAWFDSWSGTRYDPRTRQIIVAGDPPPYVIAHEFAHARQHSEMTWLFVAWRMLRGIPLVGQFLRLALEVDADQRARDFLGPLDELNETASRLVMRSYHLA